MEIVSRKEIYTIIKDNENSESLWYFLEKDLGKNFLEENDKKSFREWITKINYWHHNNSGFYQNLKQMFTQDGNLDFIEGQEDIGVIRKGTESVIVRNADMGLAIGLHSPDLKNLSESQWKNFEKILSAIDVGLINAKDFHSLISFDTISNELKNKDSVKEKKVKL